MIVDTNVYLSRWPFRRLPGDEPAKLVSTLRGHGVVQAWAGSFDGILHKDVAAVNERLAADCARFGNGMLLPMGTVNPTLADWREDLRRCHERHRMRGIRLHPNYHGYDLSSPLFVELLEAATARGLLVQIVACMEDVRTQHPLVRVKDVDLAPLTAHLDRLPRARVQVLNAKRGVAGAHLYFDIAMMETFTPSTRLLFGSNFPLFTFESALLKARASGAVFPDKID